jgi:hypothetical protein
MAEDGAARAAAGGRLHQRPGPPAAAGPPRTTALVVQPPTTTSGGVKFSGAVRLPPGYSNGLVTSQGLTGQRRPDPDGGTQVAVRVAGAAWVGKLPGRVWIPGLGTICPDCVVLDPIRLGEKGFQWVVTVHDADAVLIDAWPVSRGRSGSPRAASCRSPMTWTAGTRTWWTWTP